ncbi:hypothetical protein Droror1_Dr00017230 [Drosera rotundifolia]
MEHNYLAEIQGKMSNDHLQHHTKQIPPTTTKNTTRCILVTGPVIIGAGPSGLAAAACLREKGIPSLVLERSNCIASLWQQRTYDRLRLHLPKTFCELPMMPFPSEYPPYPTKQQFVAYLEDYAMRFCIKPIFSTTVVGAEYDEMIRMWRVRVTTKSEQMAEGPQIHQPLQQVEYVCRWLVVATGENAEVVVPEMEGAREFEGELVHTSGYRSGEGYRGKRVLVVGCGNSGMEVCLDLCHHGAMPSIVVRDTVHILPREMLGRSTFGLSMWLLKWLPITLVDSLLLILSWLILGDTSRLGLHRPLMGPLQLKNLSGKTPVLDVGTFDKIKSGDIKVRPSIRRLKPNGVEFVDGVVENFDAIILATGYRSNVPSWLNEKKMFSEKDGLPRRPFPNGWKGENGLYAVGFTKRGLLGTSMDATRIAMDIESCWKSDCKGSLPPTSHLAQT